MFRTVLIDRDIVLVDQRGTGESNPLDCEFDQDRLDADPAESLELLRSCLEGFDADPRLYTTPIAMDDLDEVREYLGYDRINLYGGSYGTRAAMVYLKRHPDRVRSVVLDGVAPTDMGLPLYMARDGQRAFDLLAEACEADAGCAAAFPDFASRFHLLLDRLDRNPPTIRVVHPRTGEEEEVTVTRFLVGSIVFAALYSPETSAMIPFLVDRAEAGSWEGFIALGSINESAADEMSLGMRYSVVCAEDAPRLEPGAIERETAGTFMGQTTADLFLQPCEFWPRGQISGDYYEAFASEVPALILSGELDPVTPPVWGEQVAGQWVNARHIVVPGIGHGTAARGCTMRIIRQFLDAASAEDLNAACTERLHRRPFFLGYSGPMAPPPPSGEAP
jgi:pimeloyl-ACP methyl ester carboxylesterase